MSLENTPKSDELLQAQVAAYAAEELDRSNADHLLNGLGSLALHGSSDEPLRLVTEELRIVPDGDTGFFKTAVVEEEKTVAEPAGYTRFLQEKGGSHYGPIHARAELLKKYGDFKPEVTALQEELQKHNFHDEHPGYLGRGLTSTGTLLEKDGQQYVMRSLSTGPLKAADVDHYVDRMIRGRGLPHFEQLSALSYEDGVLVSEKMPGERLTDLSPVELNRDVTDQQLDELVDTLKLATEHDIELDPKDGNSFYDKSEGFGFIDYNKADPAEEQVAKLVDWGSILLMASGVNGSPESTQDYVDDLPQIAAEIAIIERFEAACQRRLSEKDYNQSIPAVLERRNSLLARYANYSNPDWVAQRMVEMEQRRANKAALPAAIARDGAYLVESDVIA